MKRKIILSSLIFLGIALNVGVYLLNKYQASNKVPHTATTTNVSVITSAFEELAKPKLGAAKMLTAFAVTTNKTIISANIVPVGVDATGALETPTLWTQAGWFDSGTRPGGVGNMIINGHYDDNYGRPAAFWELKSLKVGDTVSVQDSFSRLYTYRVIDSKYIDINDPNRAQIYDSKTQGKALLTLITCGGVWIPSQHNYNMRLVVKAELI